MRNKHKNKRNAEIKTQNTIEHQHTNNTMDPFFGFWRQTAKPNPKPTKERTSFGAKARRRDGIILSAARNVNNIITEFKDAAAAQLKRSGHDQILFCDGDIIDIMT